MGRSHRAPKDLLEYVKELEQRISNLERSQRAPNTSVDRGSITVNNGAIVDKHPNGVELFRTGTGQTTLPFDVSPTDGYVTRLKRANGNTVLEVFSSSDGTEARIFIQDRAGNTIFDEDWLIGRGLGRPYIGWNWFTPTEDTTPPQVVTSASYVDVYQLSGIFQHPSIQVKIRIAADIGTAGNIRIQDTFFNTTQWSDSIAAGFNSTKIANANIHALRNYGDDCQMALQVQRTAGTGNIRIGLQYVYGRSAISL